MKRIIIPYNPILKEYAKNLRRKMTFSEVKLWNELKRGKMMGYDFDRQRCIGNYIVDFYCKDLLLAIEVDGITHEEAMVAAKDIIRQRKLEETGVHFLRFNAMLIVNDVEAAVKAIASWIEENEKKNGVPFNVQEKK